MHNADEIERKDIRIGDYVRVRKAAEIIPEIVDVDIDSRTGNEEKFMMPERCPACNSEIVRLPDEAAYRCPNRASCPAQLVEGLRYFASRNGMNIKGIGKKLCERLISSGKVKSLSDIYELELSDLVELEKIAEKSADNILSELELSKTRPFVNLITALGIPDVGKDTASLLVERFGNLDSLINADESDLSSVDGIGPVIAKSVHEFFRNDENMKMMKKFREMGFSMGSENVTTENRKLDGRIFVFTGALSSMTRENAGELVKSFGGKTSSSVSKKTSYVVEGENSGSKLEKAEKLGIKIISESEFLDMIKAQG